MSPRFGSGIAVDVEIKEGEWAQYLDQDRAFVQGDIERIGVIAHGMVSGRPSFALLARTQDGGTIYVQASWRAVAMGMVALIARWGTP